MTVDFILDITCLWSYITWRQLRNAIQESDTHPVISVFFVPPQPFFAGFETTPAERNRMLEERARPLLNETGIFVDFDRLPHLSGNIRLPCDLARKAFFEQKYNVLDEIFSAFFAFGQDITDTNVLSRIAQHNGIKSDSFETFGAQPSLPLNMPEGLRTVPCLIFNQKSILFGAQNVPCLKNMLFLSKILKKENTF